MIDNVLEAACIGVALARLAAQTQAAQFRKARLHSGQKKRQPQAADVPKAEHDPLHGAHRDLLVFCATTSSTRRPSACVTFRLKPLK